MFFNGYIGRGVPFHPITFGYPPFVSLANYLRGAGGHGGYAGYSYPGFGRFCFNQRPVSTFFSYGCGHPAYNNFSWMNFGGLYTYMGFGNGGFGNYFGFNFNPGFYGDSSGTSWGGGSTVAPRARSRDRGVEDLRSREEAPPPAEVAPEGAVEATAERGAANPLQAFKKFVDGSAGDILETSLRDNAIVLTPKEDKYGDNSADPKRLEYAKKLRTLFMNRDFYPSANALPDGTKLVVGEAREEITKKGDFSTISANVYTLLEGWRPSKPSSQKLGVEIPPDIRYFVGKYSGSGNAAHEPLIGYDPADGGRFVFGYDPRKVKETTRRDGIKTDAVERLVTAVNNLMTQGAIKHVTIEDQAFNRENPLTAEKLIEEIKRKYEIVELPAEVKPVPSPPPEPAREAVPPVEPRPPVAPAPRPPAPKPPAPEPPARVPAAAEPAAPPAPAPVEVAPPPVPEPPASEAAAVPELSPAQQILSKYVEEDRLAPNYGDEQQVHYKVEGLSQEDGEVQLAALTRTAPKEEAWYYVEGTEEGKTFKRWYEVGVNEENNRADNNMDVPQALDASPDVRITKVVHYHIHPNTGNYVDTEVPSPFDLNSIYKQAHEIGGFKNPGFKFEVRVVTPEGVYSIEPERGLANAQAKHVQRWIEGYLEKIQIDNLGRKGVLRTLSRNEYISAEFKYHDGVRPKYIQDIIEKEPWISEVPGLAEDIYDMDEHGILPEKIRGKIGDIKFFRSIMIPYGKKKGVKEDEVSGVVMHLWKEGVDNRVAIRIFDEWAGVLSIDERLKRVEGLLKELGTGLADEGISGRISGATNAPKLEALNRLLGEIAGLSLPKDRRHYPADWVGEVSRIQGQILKCGTLRSIVEARIAGLRKGAESGGILAGSRGPLVIPKENGERAYWRVGNVDFRRAGEIGQRIGGIRHDYVVLSQTATPEDIELELARYTRPGLKEDAWAFVEFDNGEKYLFECGEDESVKGVMTDISFVVGLLKDGKRSVSQLIFYHNHPLPAKEEEGKVTFMPLSSEDMDSSIGFKRDLKEMGYQNAVSFRAVTQLGVYSIVMENSMKTPEARAFERTEEMKYTPEEYGRRLAKAYGGIDEDKGRRVECTFRYYHEGMRDIVQRFFTGEDEIGVCNQKTAEYNQILSGSNPLGITGLNGLTLEKLNEASERLLELVPLCNASLQKWVALKEIVERQLPIVGEDQSQKAFLEKILATSERHIGVLRFNIDEYRRQQGRIPDLIDQKRRTRKAAAGRRAIRSRG